MSLSRKTLWQIYSLIKFWVDIILCLICFFISYHIRFYNKIFIHFIPPVKGIPPIENYYKFIPFFIFVCIISYVTVGHYKQQFLRTFDEVVLNIKTAVVFFLLLFAVSFFYRSYEYSRVFLLLVVCTTFVVTTLWHISVNYFYQKYVKYLFGKPRVGFICSVEKKGKIINRLRNNKTIKKYFLTSFSTRNDILNFVNSRKITEIVITYENFTTKVFQETLIDLFNLGIPIKVMVSFPVKLSDVLIDSTLGIPLVWVKPLSLTGINFFIKRSIDICISILVLSILFLPMLFIALIIKLDDPEGPVFFIHNRVGKDNKVFKCIKFRTMVKDAHKMWWDLLKYSERGDKVFKLKNDPRVTRAGKWLRKYSIDELPQFFNILKGDMSIVGPRPQIVEEASFYDYQAKHRLMTLPGLTGLWQISGRADTTFEQMIDLDLYYIENWSLGLDLEIIFKTIFVIFSKKGAY